MKDTNVKIFAEQKIIKICEIVKSWNINWMEMVYLTLLSGYILQVYLGTTTLDYDFLPHYGQILYNAILCFVVVNMLFGDKLTKMKAVFVGILIFAVMYTTLYNGNYQLVDMVLLCIGARGVSFRKIAYVFLCIAVQVQALAMIFSLTGLSVNYVYEMERGIRNSFGICYPTDFAAHILFILLVYSYLRWKSITYVEIVAMLGIAVVTYKYTLARNNVLCIILLCVLLGAYKIIKHFKINLSQFRCIKWIPYIFTGLALLMILLSLLYNGTGIWEKLNSLLSNRLIMGKQGFTEAGIHLSGVALSEQGFGGGNIVDVNGYFFLDSSYVRILIKYGIIIFLLVNAAYIHIGKKLIKNQCQYGLIFIVIIAVSSFMEHHLLELAYNPFTLMAFSNLTSNISCKGGMSNER